MAQINLGNGFSIDLSDAQKFIQALRDAMISLDGTYFAHGYRLYVPAPGHDSFSGDYANRANAAIQDYKAWSHDQQATLQSLINQVTAAVASYEQTEQHNTMGH